MSTENNVQTEQEITLDLADLINASRIMEHAVARNAFKVEELVEVAPVVSKFVAFANKALADIQAEKEAAAANEAKDQSAPDEEKGE